MEDWIKDLTMDMIPEAYRDLAELVGIEGLVKLAQAFGGATIYIPKADTLLRPARDINIKKDFNGYNHLELAKKYDITERWVREICGPGHNKDQIDIFEFLPREA